MALSVGLACSAWSSIGLAQLAAAVDVSMVRATVFEGEMHPGVDGRLGYRFGLPRSLHIHTVIFDPEVILGYIDFADRRGHEMEWGRLGAGGRVGLTLGYFELFGLGHAAPAWNLEEVHMLYDVGGALDVRFPWPNGIWPHLSFGIQGVYDLLSTAPRQGWTQFGGHVEYHWSAD